MTEKRKHEAVEYDSDDWDSEYEEEIRREELLRHINFLNDRERREFWQYPELDMKPTLGLDYWREEGREEWKKEEDEFDDNGFYIMLPGDEERQEEYAEEYHVWKTNELKKAKPEVLEAELEKLRSISSSNTDWNLRLIASFKEREARLAKNQPLKISNEELAIRGLKNLKVFKEIKDPFYENAVKYSLSFGSKVLRPWIWEPSAAVRWLGYLKWKMRLRLWGAICGTMEKYEKPIGPEQKSMIKQWWANVYIRSGVKSDTMAQLNTFIDDWQRKKYGKYKYQDLFKGSFDIVNK